MPIRLNPEWCQKMTADAHSSLPVDYTSNLNLAIQYTIFQLSNAGRPFKLYNLGAGVKRITTDTDTCPCCKRKLKEA